MLYVYRTPDCHARCITFDDGAPPAPFELVRAFSDEEREKAWHFLLELGGQPSVV
jgi:hypothetical protein